MAGPVLGAVLMECLPVFAVMLVDILGAAFAISCLLTVSIPDVPGSRQKLRLKDDLKRGFRAMKSNRPLMGVLFPILFSTVLYMPLGSLFPLLVRLHYAGGAEHTAIVECVFSALSAAMTLSTPFGLLIAGPVSETVGVAGWFWVSGILMAASGLVCFLATRRYDGSSGCGSDGRKKD